MMGVNGCQTKRDLKGKIGQRASGLFQETSMFGLEFKGDGEYVVVGPDPYVRKWYAEVTVVDGKVHKVK